MGLEQKIEAYESARRHIETSICRKLANLDFQSMCGCGFNGRCAPIEQEIESLKTAEAEIDEQLIRFFAKESVRKRIAKWLDDGLEATETTIKYVSQKAALPKIENIQMLDQHLSGLDIIQVVDVEKVKKLLETQTWDKPVLIAEINRFINDQSGTKLRFESPETEGENTVGLAKWCLKQALKNGVPLPKSLPTRAVESAAEYMRVDWIGPSSLEKMAEMRLPQSAEDQIVAWVVRGEIQTKRLGNPSPLIACATEMVEPRNPQSPAELAQLVSTLYSWHHRMIHIASENWLSHLNKVANWSGLSLLPSLGEMLEKHQGAEWIVIDGLGIAFVDFVPDIIEDHLPRLCLDSVEYVASPRESTTKGLYNQFAKDGVAHRFFKFDYLDTLIHERFLPLAKVIDLFRAELGIFLGTLKKKLPHDKSLVVFGDHGFSIAEDGRSYGHNSGRSLDRIVPLMTFSPRH